MDGTQHDILEALEHPRCAVCTLAGSAAAAYLTGIMRDGVNDAVVRNDWRRRGGLCARHWRAWRGLESPALSSAILTRDLLGSYLRQGLPNEQDCRACRIERDAERRCLESLATLPTERVEASPETDRGFVCLRHLERLPAGALRRALEARLQDVLTELSEFIRKSDYRYAREPRGPEGDAWLRAVRALGGDV